MGSELQEPHMKRVRPNREQITRYVEMGLSDLEATHQYELETGIQVVRTTILNARDEHELKPNRERPRYAELIPWHVHEQHRMKNDARMLRFESRRRSSKPLRDKDMSTLVSWLRRLHACGAVVAYMPASAEGFTWIPRGPQDIDIIRERELGPGDSWTHIPHD